MAPPLYHRSTYNTVSPYGFYFEPLHPFSQTTTLVADHLCDPSFDWVDEYELHKLTDSGAEATSTTTNAVQAPAPPSPAAGFSKKPKRMLNCYNLFFQHHRRLVNKQQVAASGRKLAFGEMAKTISYRWKNISPEEKAHVSYLSSFKFVGA